MRPGCLDCQETTEGVKGRAARHGKHERGALEHGGFGGARNEEAEAGSGQFEMFAQALDEESVPPVGKKSMVPAVVPAA